MTEPHEIKEHVRRYVMVGIILFLGTLLTVMASWMNFGAHWMNVVVALLIATVKASFVAAIFMHLMSEKTAIYLVLGFTLFFFLGMIGLTMLAHSDVPAM